MVDISFIKFRVDYTDNLAFILNLFLVNVLHGQSLDIIVVRRKYIIDIFTRPTLQGNLMV